MKFLFGLLLLPFLFISCGDKNLDRSLDGIWYGRVKTSDLDILDRASNSSEADVATYETIILRVHKENMTIYRSLDKDVLINQVEIEQGVYSKSGKTLTFNISKFSCAGLNPERPRKRIMSYERSADFRSLKVSFFVNKSITLVRPDMADEEVIEQQLASSDIGCFEDSGAFKKGKLETFSSLQNLEDIREIESAVQTELSTDQIDSNIE